MISPPATSAPIESEHDRLALVEAALFELLRILVPAEAVPFVAHRIAQRAGQGASIDDVKARLGSGAGGTAA